MKVDGAGGIDVAALLDGAGFAAGVPVALAACGRGGLVLNHVSGRWRSGEAVDPADRFYAASLGKQITGAAVALLVRDGAIDPDREIPRRFLPNWPVRPTPRQLLHHIGGLPGPGVLEAALDQHWTKGFALAGLAATPAPAAPPGSDFAYSNAGYIVLARLVETAAGQTFAEFVSNRLLMPLGLPAMIFADETEMPKSPQVPELSPILPLSTGDGGLWTTAADFARWLDAQNRDALGVAALVTEDARLPSGDAVGYGWGIGLREFRGHALLGHSGSWTGARARAVRCPALGLSVAVFAAMDRDEPTAAVVEFVMNRLADQT